MTQQVQKQIGINYDAEFQNKTGKSSILVRTPQIHLSKIVATKSFSELQFSGHSI